MRVLGWYVVDRDGDATRVKHETEGKKEIRYLNKHMSDYKPYRCVLLAEIDESEIPKEKKE